MPIYYFDIDDGRQKLTDSEGCDVPNAEAAQDRALELLPHHAREALMGIGSRDVAVTVRNEDGDAVFTATMTLRSEWLIQR